MERASEQGSSLMLAPAALLVLLVLASVSVDSAIAYLGKRQLDNAVAAAANDAATLAIPNGIGTGTLQDGKSARPDAQRAQAIAQAEVMRAYSGGLTVRNVTTAVNGDTVTVTADGTVKYIFAKAIPGMKHGTVVRSESTATLRFR